MIEIKRVFDHYVIFIDGLFYCSADTYAEARRESEDLR